MTDEGAVAQAMALPDGAVAELGDGRRLYAGHRLVQDGARAALLELPGVLRVDVHPQGDSFDLSIRNLGGPALADVLGPLLTTTHHAPDGRALNEYRTHADLPDGVRVDLVIRVAPFAGELLREHSAVAIVDPQAPMRRLVLRVRAEELDLAYDRLLPLLPAGVHPQAAGDEVVLVALGRPGDLPAATEVAQALGALLVEPARVDDDAGPLVAALTQLTPPVLVCGGRVCLRAPAHPPPVAAGPGAPPVIDVVLGRGAGFGIGTHATTRHCLELLLDLPPDGAFADLGCGAGALAIVAARLGHAPVVGVDLLEAVTAQARANVEANGVFADIVTGDLCALDGLDVEAAAVNVSEPGVHAHLASVPLPRLRSLIVCGLRDPAQLAAALAAYAAAGLTEVRRVDGDDWPAVLLQRVEGR